MNIHKRSNTKNTVQTIQNTVSTSIHNTITPTHTLTHTQTFTHPHIRACLDTRRSDKSLAPPARNRTTISLTTSPWLNTPPNFFNPHFFQAACARLFSNTNYSWISRFSQALVSSPFSITSCFITAMMVNETRKMTSSWLFDFLHSFRPQLRGTEIKITFSPPCTSVSSLPPLSGISKTRVSGRLTLLCASWS